jgi:hypothetical protein
MIYSARAHDIIAKVLGFHYCSSVKLIEPEGHKAEIFPNNKNQQIIIGRIISDLRVITLRKKASVNFYKFVWDNKLK